MNKLTPYALLLAGAVGLALYPRILGAGAPPALASDGVVGFVHGICIGLEMLAVILLSQSGGYGRRTPKTARS